ncbi:MAG: sodium:calcium antiporter [Acidobacteriota bacterium]|nr:sodium:calcium antiporter [Acidobacteriota bacterium]
MISWSAELLQLDLSQNLAIAIIALVTVLPEYTVDIYLSWTAATVPENVPLALANMTGANRLLIGLGWPMVLAAVIWKGRGRHIELEPARWGELLFLGAATVYSLVIPLKGTLTLWDTAILGLIFVLYIRYVARQEVVEPDLEGPAALFAAWSVGSRRLVTGGLFLFAAVTLFASAEPFAEGLKFAGEGWGISEFLMIQWIAPLASESPEFLIALIFTLRGASTAGLGALVSSKVNQWTLLVGMIPLAYMLGLLASGQQAAVFPLGPRQQGEVLLTAAQSFFAVVVILDRRFSVRDAVLLATLFIAQLGITIGIEEMVDPARQMALFHTEKIIFSILYFVLGGAWLVRQWHHLPALLKLVWEAER